VYDSIFDQPQYATRAVYYFRHFPFVLDPYDATGQSHRAAEAAYLQDLFWEMADSIFDDSPIYDEALLLAKAEEVGCDMDQFIEDYDAGVVWDQIVEDRAVGSEAGVFGTPTVFVNGIMVYPWTKLQDVLDCLLGYSVYVPPDAGVDGGS
jgi:protein-disulfide isomerase